MATSHLAKLFSVVFLLFFLTNISLSQVNNEKLTPDEEKRVVDFIANVNRQLVETRDVSTFLNQPQTNEYSDRSLKRFFSDESMITKEVVNIASPKVLKKFWIEVTNLFYLSTLYRYSKYFDPNDQNIEYEQQFPKNVRYFLKNKSCWLKNRNDDDECEISSLVELEKKITTLIKVSTMMRNYFKIHPPEKTRTYKKNLLKSFQNTRKYIHTDTCKKAEGDCLGLPVNTKTIRTYLLFSIVIFFAEINGEFKVLLFGGID